MNLEWAYYKGTTKVLVNDSTTTGALKAYAAHVQEGVRRNTATDRAPFEVV